MYRVLPNLASADSLVRKIIIKTAKRWGPFTEF
jgi:hypothetical protein